MRGRGPGRPYARTTITVPMKLKRRMKALGSEVNWSAVACAAFETKVNELTSEEEVDSLDVVVERLRRFRTVEEVRDDDAFNSGVEAGRKWAMSSAAPGQLQRLQEFRDNHDDQQWTNFISDENGFRAIARCLNPEAQGGPGGPRGGGGRHRRGRGPRRDHDEPQQHRGRGRGMRARRVWMMILDEWPEHTDFFPGFVEGALDVWRDVKDRL